MTSETDFPVLSICVYHKKSLAHAQNAIPNMAGWRQYMAGWRQTRAGTGTMEADTGEMDLGE